VDEDQEIDWKVYCLGCCRLRSEVDFDPTSFVRRTRIPTEPDDHCEECKKKPELVRLAEGTR
jgi:hypothetical protein